MASLFYDLRQAAGKAQEELRMSCEEFLLGLRVVTYHKLKTARAAMTSRMWSRFKAFLSIWQGLTASVIIGDGVAFPIRETLRASESLETVGTSSAGGG